VTNWQIDEQQLNRLNLLLQRSSDVLVHNCVTRTAQESKLFPVLPYLMNSMMETYYRFPDIIREASVVVSPEELGRRARESTHYLSALTSWATLNYYLNGRGLLIRLGLYRPEDNLEDLWTVSDWWMRFQSSYRQAEGHSWALDGGDVLKIHQERTLQVFEADAYEVDDALLKATIKFMSSATQYSFLVNCESRTGLQAAGPYRVTDRLLMHTRDFMNLGECDFSWVDGIGVAMPYNNLTVSLITEDVRVEVTDWGTAYTVPEEYSQRIRGVGLYTSDFLTDGYLPVGMGSRAELTDALLHLANLCAKATRELYSRYAGFTNVQMTEAGVYTYLSPANGISHAAGTYRQSQFEFIDDRMRRLWPIFNEEYAMDAYIDHFALSTGRNSAWNEYYMDTNSYGSWRAGSSALPGNGRNSALISRRVLADDDYARRVNPKGPADWSGTSSLPVKSSTYTTTQGKFSEDGLNAAARSFSSPVFQEPWASIDDAWVKWHWKGEDVQGLYRHTQNRSRLLAGRGSGLRREDINTIRRKAGERSWGDIA
jgi:hypothetical protein